MTEEFVFCEKLQLPDEQVTLSILARRMGKEQQIPWWFTVRNSPIFTISMVLVSKYTK